MNYPLTQISLEAPGGIIKVIAECEDNKVKVFLFQIYHHLLIN